MVGDATDPSLAAQRNVTPGLTQRKYVPIAIRRLAALVEADQRTEKPGNLDHMEVNFLLRSQFTHDLKHGYISQLFYLLGRYYDFCGHPEKANEYFRRVLAVRADFNNSLRCLTVKELRKSGLTNEEYVKYSQGDPKFPRFKSSNTVADILCRQHFRVYTESPSETVLERPAAAEPIAPTDFGETTAWNPKGTLYKVTKILFGSEAVPENNIVVYWWFYTEKSQICQTDGIGFNGTLPVHVSQQQPDGTYPLKFGTEEDAVSASASFHGDNLALTVWLKPDTDPIRIEMQKVERK